MQWPDNFPDACPPEDAQLQSISAYLLVHSPILPTDFHSLKQRHPEQTFPNLELECQAYGLSVFEKIEHLRRVRSRVRRLRHRAIAVGNLTPEAGVVKPTSSRFGDSHRTWWVPIDVKPWKLFHIVAE